MLKSRYHSLYAVVMLAINAGMRASEIGGLIWAQVVSLARSLTGGPVQDDGRYRAHHPAKSPRRGRPHALARPFPRRPSARKPAKVSCRLHDLRHTFISRLAESQASDSTVMALAGHVSRAMMERYSHIRVEAKRRAVDDLSGTGFEPGVAQNWAQFFVSEKSGEAKSLRTDGEPGRTRTCNPLIKSLWSHLPPLTREQRTYAQTPFSLLTYKVGSLTLDASQCHEMPFSVDTVLTREGA
jgi:hypothetical protein